VLSKTERLRQDGRKGREAELLKLFGDTLPEGTPQLLTYEQVGEILGYSPSTVAGLCRDGKLGSLMKTSRYGVFLRRRRWIPRADVLKFMVEYLHYTPAKPKAPPTTRVRRVS
jgi:hypothetical protein